MAGELQAKLENMGYNVFLDVDDLGSGQFPVQIEKAIEECKDFLIVLSPGTLDRCQEEDDWVRREIVIAQSLNKNIVGVGLPGFVMPAPESLPYVLHTLPTRQVFLWTHEYRSASLSRIVDNLVSTQIKKQRDRNRKTILFTTLSAVLLAVVIVLLARSFGNRDKAVPLPPNDDNMVETTFDKHVTRAMSLSDNLPSAEDFRDNFDTYIDSSAIFQNLAEALVEYDLAIALKKDDPKSINDTVGVEGRRKALESLRSEYVTMVMDDLQIQLDVESETTIKYACQDIEMARIMATPAENRVLDSLESIERQLENKLSNE